MSATNYAKLAEVAAEHHSTLSVFAAVTELMEGALVYDPAAYATAQRIIRLCRQERQRQLKKYDAAIAKLKESK
jgi:hypothetical protein